jgi:DNA topoisomerase IA
LTNCTGNITIEASLATTPSSTDWFKVYELVANANAASNSAPQIASNASVYTNVNGNFVYMRARVVDFQGGLVNFVKLSY